MREEFGDRHAKNDGVSKRRAERGHTVLIFVAGYFAAVRHAQEETYLSLIQSCSLAMGAQTVGESS